MKILIASLLLAGLGVGSWQFASDAPASSCPQSCDATVSCTPDGHCLIECTGPSGQTCSVELACDGQSCTVVDSHCSPGCTEALASECCKAEVSTVSSK
jgi:hypothetical protein